MAAATVITASNDTGGSQATNSPFGIRGDAEAAPVIDRLVRVSLDGLKMMYARESRRFVFSHRCGLGGWANTAEVSDRYTAIAVIGLSGVDQARHQRIVDGPLQDLCGHLIDGLPGIDELGTVALVAWAAARCDSPRVEEAYRQLADRLERVVSPPTVQLAWALTALSVRGEVRPSRTAETKQAFERLLARYHPQAGVFDTGSHRRPRHVACFADQVYPIQALAHYYGRTGDEQAVDAARRCARRMCRLQGSDGQWWWHYDTRTGQVVEGYPVYSVHQDSMAPMALLDLARVCDEDFSDSIKRGLLWLIYSPELGKGMFAEDRPVIWRKVARCDPDKLVRKVRAVSTALHSQLKFRSLDRLYRPTAVDYECRPYHLGWVLYTWCPEANGDQDAA